MFPNILDLTVISFEIKIFERSNINIKYFFFFLLNIFLELGFFLPTFYFLSNINKNLMPII